MFYYSLSLHNAFFIMVNSTWTKNHVNAVLGYTTNDTIMSNIHSVLAKIACSLSPVFRIKEVAHHPIQTAYPSCDTTQMSTFPLAGRKRIILSLAQFRYALKQVLEQVTLMRRIVPKKTMLHNCNL